MKTILTALLFLAAAGPAAAASSCIVPSVATANVVNVTRDGNLSHYRVAINITNATGGTQASNTLQFVDIYHDRQKLDAIGIPPLHPNGSYKAYYTFTRSSDAGDGTTKLHLPIRMVQPVCTATAPAATVTF
ncbi:MAG: hypothetical protein JO322_08555 [Candidatus Eremiobacteraeota bacterium]|nr:hypothetical protein [Candidatus Eremiobacteraeota bacterium]